jgi:hypothetical protein
VLPSALQRHFPWLLRLWWAALPFTAGPSLAAGLRGWNDAPRTLASVGLWAGWAVGLAATFVPHPIGLTTLRVLAPAGLVAAVASAAASHFAALAIAWTAVMTSLVLAPDTGMFFVNGPAYPNERRFPLRAPAPLLAGPIALAWALAVTGIAAGPLLLADRHWVAGGIALVLGVPVAAVLLRSLHGLSRRWAVFVPAGLVLHDPLTLTDSVLLRRQEVDWLRPAPAGSNALDLSQRAPGLALEVVLHAEAQLSLVRPGRRGGRPRSADRLLVTPTLPGALLEEAARRRFGLGSKLS